MIFRRRRRDEHVEGTGARQRAEADLKRAQADLERTRADTPKYAELAARIRRLRERNHLREGFEAMFRGGTAT